MAANTVICGTSGSVTLPTGHGARIASFSCDLLHEVYDCTGYSSGGYRQNSGGLKSASGTASGWLTKGSSTDQPGFTNLTTCDQGAAMTLTADTGCTITGSFNISLIRIDSSVADNARISFQFISTSTLVETWATS